MFLGTLNSQPTLEKSILLTLLKSCEVALYTSSFANIADITATPSTPVCANLSTLS